MAAWRAAVVTGASSGIGEVFARRLAAAGSDLVLVARSEDKLRDLARQLAELYSRRVEVVALDLSHPGAADKLKAATDALHLPVDLLVNNAGFGTTGPFAESQAQREREEIQLNATTLTDLCRAYLPAMVERGSGAIVNVASLAGFQPLPYMAVYAATKAFVVSFSESLRAELAGSGVKVVCVCPGPVDTPFFDATGKGESLRRTVPAGTMVSAETVVTAALRALAGRGGIVVPGAAAKLLALGSKLTPNSLLAAMTARVMRR